METPWMRTKAPLRLVNIHATSTTTGSDAIQGPTGSWVRSFLRCFVALAFDGLKFFTGLSLSCASPSAVEAVFVPRCAQPGLPCRRRTAMGTPRAQPLQPLTDTTTAAGSEWDRRTRGRQFAAALVSSTSCTDAAPGLPCTDGAVSPPPFPPRAVTRPARFSTPLGLRALGRLAH